VFEFNISMAGHLKQVPHTLVEFYSLFEGSKHVNFIGGTKKPLIKWTSQFYGEKG